MREEFLLPGACPGLKRDLAIRRIADATGGAIGSRPEVMVAGRGVAWDTALGVGPVVLVGDGVGPVALNVRLPIRQARSGPFAGGNLPHCAFPASPRRCRLLGCRIGGYRSGLRWYP